MTRNDSQAGMMIRWNGPTSRCIVRVCYSCGMHQLPIRKWRFVKDLTSEYIVRSSYKETVENYLFLADYATPAWSIGKLTKRLSSTKHWPTSPGLLIKWSWAWLIEIQFKPQQHNSEAKQILRGYPNTPNRTTV